MIPNQTVLKRFIKAKLNFFVYGPRASGKTTLLKTIFQDAKVDYIYINCTMGDKKVNFFKYLNHQLDLFFKKQIKEKLDSTKTLTLTYQKQSDPANVHAWVQNIKKLSPQLKDLLQNIYFFIDNIQQINLSTNFITTFYSACQEDMIENVKIPFVFCGITLPRKIYAVDKPFRNITSFCMRKPFQLMKKIILEDVTNIFKKQFIFCNQVNKKILQNIKQSDVIMASQLIAQQIFHAFQPMQTDLNRIKKMTYVIAKRIAQAQIKQIQQQIEMKKSSQIPKGIQKRMHIKINKGQIRKYTKEILETGPVDAFTQRKVLSSLVHDDIETQLQYKQYYPNLLLSSFYLADQASEADDKRRFQDYKKQSGKSTNKHTQFRMGKHNLQRIISIAEVLESNGKKDGPQYNLQHHSLNFYACFQFLRQEEKVFHSGKNICFNSHKIHADTKLQETKTFLKTKMDLNMQDYMPNNPTIITKK